MRPTVSERRTPIAVLAVAMALVLSVAAPAAAIPQPDGTVGLAQSADQGTVAPGATVTLETTINATGYNAPAVSADLPAGWSLTGQSAEGPATFKSSTNEWVWLSGGEYTVTYTVQVPGDASGGDYTVTADGSAIDPADDGFVSASADTGITVETQADNQPPVADAGADQTVPEGTSVTLDATGSTDPDGDSLSFAWTQTGGPSVGLTDTNTATPDLTVPQVDGDQTLTFEVTVSDGQATDSDTVAVTATDDEVQPAPGDGISVTLAAPAGTSVSPGGTAAVEATVNATGLNAPALNLTLPSGWSVASQTAEGPATYKPATNEWVWLSGGEYDVSLTVQVPAGAAAGGYTVGAEASAIDPGDDDQPVTDTAQLGLTVSDAEQPPAVPSSAVALSPSSGEVVVGGTQTFDVVVQNADGGVGAYTATVSVSDLSTASVTDASLHDTANDATSSVQIAADGSSVTLNAALMDTADTGSVTVGTVTVAGESEGTADATLGVSALGTESGQGYDVAGTSGATLSVVALAPVDDFPQPPTDPDGDGFYEDINGDGTFDIVDVQALFAHMDGTTIQSNVESFDFNGDGTVDVVDVQAMFDELLS